MSAVPPAVPGPRFLLAHPAHLIALGFGSGLSPVAPGTVGTLWAWLVFAVLDRWLDAAQWGVVVALSFAIGWWACTRAARKLGLADPGAIVWDEVARVLARSVADHARGFLVAGRSVRAVPILRRRQAWPRWVGRPLVQAPGGEGAIGWREGFGILFDDLVAAFCTLLTIALALALGRML